MLGAWTMLVPVCVCVAQSSMSIVKVTIVCSTTAPILGFFSASANFSKNLATNRYKGKEKRVGAKYPPLGCQCTQV